MTNTQHTVSYRPEHGMWAVQFPGNSFVKDWADTEAKAIAMALSYDKDPQGHRAAMDAANAAQEVRP
jgi:hypothetical protein